MLLVNTELRQDRELNYLAAMQRNYVAGVILMGTVYTPGSGAGAAGVSGPSRDHRAAVPGDVLCVQR